jgi:hypothetical protein
MRRILLISIGTYSTFAINTHSDTISYTYFFAGFNVVYIVFLIYEFISFLYRLQKQGTKGNEVNIIDLSLDVTFMLYDEISRKYSGKFSFLGRCSDFVEVNVVVIEIVCVFVSFYKELEFIARFPG